MKTKIEDLSGYQHKILGYLKYEGVQIKYFGKKYYVTKFGLNFKEITKDTFDALYPYLNHHDDDIYSLKPAHF
jgi:hypothetical protein